MYHEAFGMISLAEISDAGKAQHLTFGLMKAVSMVMTAENIDARTIFADLKNNYKNSPSILEVNIWDRYNEYVVGVHPEAIGVIENRNLLEHYHDEFYWKLMLAELKIANNRKNFKLIDQLLSIARKSNDLYINNLERILLSLDFNLNRNLYTRLLGSSKEDFLKNFLYFWSF